MSLELFVVMLPGVLLAVLVCLVVKTSADADRARRDGGYPASRRRR